MDRGFFDGAQGLGRQLLGLREALPDFIEHAAGIGGPAVLQLLRRLPQALKRLRQAPRLLLI